MTEPAQGPIEVLPVVVISQAFPARPSSIPDIREFVRRCLADSPLTEEGNREVGETVFRALLDAAGAIGSIQVSFRIFPEHVEVDVLHSDNQVRPGQADRGTPGGQAADAAAARPGDLAAAVAASAAGVPAGGGAGGRSAGTGGRAAGGEARAAGADGGAAAERFPVGDGRLPGAGYGGPGEGHRESGEGGGHAGSFADWMSSALRREGLTQEQAARQLGVSVKTVSRWVGGATHPRLRDLRRIQERFGEVPLP